MVETSSTVKLEKQPQPHQKQPMLSDLAVDQNIIQRTDTNKQPYTCNIVHSAHVYAFYALKCTFVIWIIQ